MTIYRVRADAEVTKLRQGTGTRRRGGLTFSREWTYLEDPPETLLNDDHLSSAEVTRKEMEAAGGRLTPLPGSEPVSQAEEAESEDTAERDDKDGLAELSINALRKLAAEEGLEASGNKAQLMARLRQYLSRQYLRRKTAATG